MSKLVCGVTALERSWLTQIMPIMLTLLAQTIAIGLLGIHQVIGYMEGPGPYVGPRFAGYTIIAVGAILGFFAIGMTKGTVHLVREETGERIRILRRQADEHLAAALGMQRSNFFSRLRTIRGFLESGNLDVARKFIRRMTDEMQGVAKVGETIGSPELAALFLSKVRAAFDKQITFEIDISPEASTSFGILNIPMSKVVTILGNLLDNAMDALMEIPEDDKERKMRLGISKANEDLMFVVWNNGPVIPRELRREVFKPGFTTKKGRGEGMGLYVAQRLVRDLSGDMELGTDEILGTSFVVRIPDKR